MNRSERKAIVEYAYENCPFYKKLYDNNFFHPSMLKTPEDWSKVPIIEKADIRNNFNDIISKMVTPKDYFQKTTGVPLKVLGDNRANYMPILWRAYSWYSVSFAADNAVVGRNVNPTSKVKALLRPLVHFPTRLITLDASSVSPRDIELFINKIRKTKPAILSGYVGTILRVARHIVSNDIKDLPIIALTHVTSAPISNLERDIIRKAFRGDIMDQYGSVEITCLAFESPEHKGLYIPDDYRHIDIVDDKYELVPDETYGNIVVTDLENRAFPLIRYKNSDRTKKLSITGNLPFTILAPIKGRVSDFIKTPSGIIVSGEYLTTIFDDYPNEISAFQVVQHKDYSLSIRYVADKAFAKEHVDKVITFVRSKMYEVTKNELEINMLLVPTIEDDRGKLRFVINELTGNLKTSKV